MMLSRETKAKRREEGFSRFEDETLQKLYYPYVPAANAQGNDTIPGDHGWQTEKS